MKILLLLLFAAAPGYRQALPGYRYQFPRDHFEHTDFRTEWWYYTGNVHAADGHRYGFELVFFRQGEHKDPGNASVWRIDDLYLAHLALTHADVPVYHQKGEAGWLTSAASRPRMLENLAAVLAAAPFLFNSSRLLEECKTFVRRPDRTMAAANGAHDDTVMAMAIALAVRTEVAVRPPAMQSQLNVATL